MYTYGGGASTIGDPFTTVIYGSRGPFSMGVHLQYDTVFIRRNLKCHRRNHSPCRAYFLVMIFRLFNLKQNRNRNTLRSLHCGLDATHTADRSALPVLLLPVAITLIFLYFYTTVDDNAGIPQIFFIAVCVIRNLYTCSHC